MIIFDHGYKKACDATSPTSLNKENRRTASREALMAPNVKSYGTNHMISIYFGYYKRSKQTE